MNYQRILPRCLLILVASLFLVACQSKFPEVHRTGVPIRVLDQKTNEVNVDVAITDASSMIGEILPDAYLAGISYIGRCEDVEDLYGKLNIMFVQKKKRVLSTSIWVADVSIDTNRQSMNIWTWDATAKYLIAKPLILKEGLSIHEIASIAARHLDTLDIEKCDVMLTRLDDSWLVVCSSSRGRICEFKIDIETGEIISESG